MNVLSSDVFNAESKNPETSMRYEQSTVCHTQYVYETITIKCRDDFTFQNMSRVTSAITEHER